MCLGTSVSRPVSEANYGVGSAAQVSRNDFEGRGELYVCDCTKSVNTKETILPIWFKNLLPDIMAKGFAAGLDLFEDKGK